MISGSRRLLLAALIALAVPRTLLAGDAASYEANPSVLTLIVAPERLAGKSIYTVGVARVEYEGFRIYVTEQDAKHRIAENSVRFDPTNSVVSLEDMKKFDMRFVQIGGTLTLEPNRDESGQLTAVIRNVTLFRGL